MLTVVCAVLIPRRMHAGLKGREDILVAVADHKGVLRGNLEVRHDGVAPPIFCALRRCGFPSFRIGAHSHSLFKQTDEFIVDIPKGKTVAFRRGHDVEFIDQG